MKLLKEFSEFAKRGNVIDMAVGIIIGNAFGKVVTSLVSDLIMPPVGFLVGGINFTNLKLKLNTMSLGASSDVTINYGTFMQTVFDFVVVAFAVFMVVKISNRLKKQQEVVPAALSSQEILLTQIRDILQEKNRT